MGKGLRWVSGKKRQRLGELDITFESFLDSLDPDIVCLFRVVDGTKFISVKQVLTHLSLIVIAVGYLDPGNWATDLLGEPSIEFEIPNKLVSETDLMHILVINRRIAIRLLTFVYRFLF